MNRDRSIPVITLCDSLGLDVQQVDAALLGLGGDIAFASGPGQTMRRYQLTFLGDLLAEQGDELEDLLARYLSYVRVQLRSDPELEKIDLAAAMHASEFSTGQKEFFLKMFFRTPFHGGGSRMETKPPQNVDEWYPCADLRKYLHESSLRNYDPQTSIDGGRQIYIQVRTPFSEITNTAIMDFEASHSSPEVSIPQFPSQVIQNFHAPVGVVQTGTQANARVNQGSENAERSEEPAPLGFIDWCGRILDVLVKESEKDPLHGRRGSMNTRFFGFYSRLMKSRTFITRLSDAECSMPYGSWQNWVFLSKTAISGRLPWQVEKQYPHLKDVGRDLYYQTGVFRGENSQSPHSTR